MFLLHYAQCSNYLFCTVFPSPYILQHYVEFDIHTIVTIEKLLGEIFFGGFTDHISFIISPFFYNIMYPSWSVTSYSCPPFMLLMWSYH
jgi:hypothetical protein